VERKIMAYLKQWQESPHRKPLILQGARQVGKTYSLLQFGRERYENVAYFNFETTPQLGRVFEESIEPDKLLPVLARLCNQTIIKEKTLIIFDEVQLCERALTSLKYFCEDAEEYHVIAAGSLLGVAVNRGKFSFPVGKVDMKTLYPMDLEEYLLACGEAELVSRIWGCFNQDTAMPGALHEAALAYYRRYLVVGGMPECVQKYLETKDLILVRHLQKTLLASYLNDMSKYNTQSETKRTRLVYDNITVQLSRPNTRFLYRLIKTGARAAGFEDALTWLELSGLVSRVFRVDKPWKPLENYRDIDSFKTYVSDVGLLCAKKDVIPEDILFLTHELDDFKGGLAENYVCSQLTASGHVSYYWSSDRGAEVDFVIQRDGKFIPVEVKAADNTKAKSLGVYIAKYQPEYAVKLSTRNFGCEGRKKTMPLYAVFCL
jgi:predicted AAA+ superfamily ATPase